MANRLKHPLRLLRIGLTLAQHDALFPLEATGIAPKTLALARIFRKRRHRHLRDGQRLALALESLGPTYIKLGQALSVRPDLVGDAVSDDLANLRDQLPPFGSAIAKAIIESELGKPLAELFASFDDEPIAAASIAQVHFAVMHDGTQVAVKILRPDIEQAFARDMDVFFWLAAIAEKCLPKYRRLKPVETMATLARTIELELDLRYEAAASAELKENTAQDAGFYVPDVYWSHTSKRVLTSERVQGISLNDMAAIEAAGLDKHKVVEHAAHAFFAQVFRDGFFHADLHPGNLFVLPDNTLAAVDFGIMGRIDRQTQLYLAEMLHAFLQEDYEKVARIHIRAGFVPPTTSVKEFAQANRAIAKPIFGKPLNEISIATLLEQLFKVAETFQMETQPQLLMLQKTMMVTEGVGRMLNPQANMWQLAEPLITAWAKDNLGVQARIKDGVQDGLASLQRLPQLVREADAMLQEMKASGIKLHPDTLAQMNKARKQQTRWIRRGVWVMALAALAYLGMLALDCF